MARRDDNTFDRSPEDRRPPHDAREHEVEHQPVSQTDVTRFPPGKPGCAKVRGMLRDYVDADLEAGEVRSVDEHVHLCRDCGLALARAELEVMRIRDAFAQERALAAEVPGTLGARVRARAGEADASQDPSASGPSKNFTQQVMQRLDGGWRAGQDAEEAAGPGRRFGSRAALALVAAVVVAGVALLFGLFGNGSQAQPVARVLVADGVVTTPSAEGSEGARESSGSASGEVGAEREPIAPVALAAGAELHSGAWIDVRAGDGADWPGLELEFVEDVPWKPGVEPGRVALDGAGRLRVDQGALHLERGSFRISLGAALRVGGLADAVAAFDPDGEYDVAIVTQRRIDSELSREPLVSVRLEVLAGGVTLARAGALGGGLREHRIEAGQVARFGHWLPLEIEAGASAALLRAAFDPRAVALATGASGSGNSGAGRTGNGALREPTLRGRVVDDLTGLGVGGALVKLDVGDETWMATTQADGTYELPRLEVSACVLEVLPPQDARLHGMRRQSVDLPTRGGSGVLDTLRLAAWRPLWGTVRTHQQQPLAGARIVPCVVDEVFGLCDVREEFAARSDESGRFEVVAPTGGFGPHEHVVLLVEHRDHPTTAVRDIERGAVQMLELTMDVPRDLRLAGLPASRRVQVLQSVDGLSARSFVVRTEVITDAVGAVTLPRAGSGRLWFLDRETGEGLALVGRPAEPSDGVAPGGEVFAQDPDATAERLALDDLGSNRRWVGRDGARLASFRAQPQNPTSRIMVLGPDAVVVPGTEIYLLSAGATVPEYLGRFDGIESFPFAAPDGRYTLVAVAPDGSIGWRDGADLVGPNGSIQIEPLGGVELDLASLRPQGAATAHGGSPTEPGGVSVDAQGIVSANLHFRMLDGPLAGQEFWREVRASGEPRVDGLLPGDYRLTFGDGSAVDVTVRGSGTVVVRAPQPASVGGEVDGR